MPKGVWGEGFDKCEAWAKKHKPDADAKSYCGAVYERQKKKKSDSPKLAEAVEDMHLYTDDGLRGLVESLSSYPEVTDEILSFASKLKYEMMDRGIDSNLGSLDAEVSFLQTKYPTEDKPVPFNSIIKYLPPSTEMGSDNMWLVGEAVNRDFVGRFGKIQLRVASTEVNKGLEYEIRSKTACPHVRKKLEFIWGLDTDADDSNLHIYKSGKKIIDVDGCPCSIGDGFVVQKETSVEIRKSDDGLISNAYNIINNNIYIRIGKSIHKYLAFGFPTGDGIYLPFNAEYIGTVTSVPETENSAFGKKIIKLREEATPVSVKLENGRDVIRFGEWILVQQEKMGTEYVLQKNLEPYIHNFVLQRHDWGDATNWDINVHRNGKVDTLMLSDDPLKVPKCIGLLKSTEKVELMGKEGKWKRGDMYITSTTIDRGTVLILKNDDGSDTLRFKGEHIQGKWGLCATENDVWEFTSLD
jgi:hypothetical protein